MPPAAALIKTIPTSNPPASLLKRRVVISRNTNGEETPLQVTKEELEEADKKEIETDETKVETKVEDDSKTNTTKKSRVSKRTVSAEKNNSARQEVLKEMRNKINSKPEVAEENLQKVLLHTWNNLTRIKGQVSRHKVL